MDSTLGEKPEEILQLRGLSSYEARAYLTILESKGVTPVQIAQESKVPPSRIYSVLKKLESENYIVKGKNGYEYVPQKLASLKNDIKKLFDTFSNYLEHLTTQVNISEEKLMEELIPIVDRAGYEVKFKGPLDKALETVNKRSSFLENKIKNIALPWILIIESKTSGYKIGLILFLSDYKLDKSFTNIFFLKDTVLKLNLDEQIIFAHKLSDTIKEFFEESLFLSLSSEFRTKLENKLIDMDKEWSKSRRDILSIQKLLDIPERKLHQLNNRMNQIQFYMWRGERKNLETWIVNGFSEIIDRINSDIKLDSELYLDLKLHCISLQSRLEDAKVLPNPSDLNQIEEDIQFVLDDLEEISMELAALRKEILDVVRASIYHDKGFHANPFVFTVPLEPKLDIVGQDSAVGDLSNFIENIQHDSNSSSLAMIVESSGMGKTHLMKHFIRKINSDSNSSTFGVYLKCNPGSDIFSIFNELRISLEKMPSSSITAGLLTVLKEIDVPLTINELAYALRSLSQFSGEMKKTLVLFLDELENLSSSDSEAEKVAIQLKHLVEVSKTNFVVALRKIEWDNEPKVQEILKQIKPSFIKLEPLKEDSLSLILNTRLKDLSIDSNPSINFTSDAISKISKESNGNIRNALTIARNGFRRAILHEKNKITPELLVVKEDGNNITNYSNSVKGLHDLQGGEK